MAGTTPLRTQRGAALLTRASVFSLAATLAATAALPAKAEKRSRAPIEFAGAAPRKYETGKLYQASLTYPVASAIDSGVGYQPVQGGRDRAAFEDRDGRSWATPYAGPPYQVSGKWFVPMEEPDYDEIGLASWYGPGFDGQKSASGEIFDQNAFTGAHPTLPIPSIVRVTNLANGRSILVRINDRGPYIDDRIMDLSKGAAKALDMTSRGTSKVRVQYVGPAPATPNSVPDEHEIPRPAVSAGRSRPEVSEISTAPLPEVQGMPDMPVAQAPVREPARDQAPRDMSGGVRLQVGSFSDLGNAQKLKDRLAAHGPAFVTTADVNGAQYYRVMMGPWDTTQEAEQVRLSVAQTGLKPILLPSGR